MHRRTGAGCGNRLSEPAVRWFSLEKGCPGEGPQKTARGEVNRPSRPRALLETDPDLNPALASPQLGTGAPGWVLLARVPSAEPEPVPRPALLRG